MIVEPNPVAVERYGTEERMAEALIAEGEQRPTAILMAAMAFGTSQGDIVETDEIPEQPSSIS